MYKLVKPLMYIDEKKRHQNKNKKKNFLQVYFYSGIELIPLFPYLKAGL